MHIDVIDKVIDNLSAIFVALENFCNILFSGISLLFVKVLSNVSYSWKQNVT